MEHRDTRIGSHPIRLPPLHRPGRLVWLHALGWIALAVVGLVVSSGKHVSAFRWTAAAGALAMGGVVVGSGSLARVDPRSFLALGPKEAEPRNFWARGSLGLALLAGLFLFEPLLLFQPLFGVSAVILGLLARRQIAQGQGRGKGMAVAGIVLGGWLVLAAGIWVILQSFVHAAWIHQLCAYC